MSRADKNAQAAVEWAKKKKEQMEKAKRLREERKMKGGGAGADTYSSGPSNGYGASNSGFDNPMGGGRDDPGLYEMHGIPPPSYSGSGYSQKNVPSYGVSDNGYPKTKDRGYGSSNYRPSSNEEIVEARQSLMLLKTKMKSSNNMK